MNRRRFVQSLGLLALPALAAPPASARLVVRHFEGAMESREEETQIDLELYVPAGRGKDLDGTIWLDQVPTPLDGRVSRNGKKFIFWTSLDDNQELRFTGKLSQRETLLSGEFTLSQNGAERESGTFSLRAILVPPPPPG